jgi:hypothetical protein
MTSASCVPSPFTAGFGPALVRRVDAAGARVLVQRRSDLLDIWTRTALADPLCAGDEVLIASGDDGEHYVIACLGQRPQGLALGGRCTAHVGQDRVLRIAAGDGTLLLEIDASAERVRVVAPTGALEVATEEGDLALRSRGAVRIDGTEVHLGARASLHLRSPALEVAAARGEFQVVEGRYIGARFVAALESARLCVQRLETLAHTVVSRARNVYRTVAELVQLRAGRLRTLVSGTSYHKSRRSLQKADEDFKVDADRIHLG